MRDLIHFQPSAIKRTHCQYIVGASMGDFTLANDPIDDGSGGGSDTLADSGGQSSVFSDIGALAAQISGNIQQTYRTLNNPNAPTVTTANQKSNLVMLALVGLGVFLLLKH